MTRCAPLQACLLLICLGLAAPAAAQSPPAAANLRDAEAVGRFVVQAIEFLKEHPDHPRAPGVALELLAVADWVERPDIANHARALLFFNYGRTPQSLLAASAMGPASYTEFIAEQFELIQQRTPAAEAALNYLIAVLNGFEAIGPRIFEDRTCLLTATALTGWLLEARPPEAIAREQRLRQLKEMLDEQMQRTLAEAAEGPWRQAADLLLDVHLPAPQRVVRLGELMHEGEGRHLSGLIMDAAILMLPADEHMDEAVLKVRAVRALDAARWDESVLLTRTLQERAAEDDPELGTYRTWQAMALVARQATADNAPVPPEALELLRAAGDYPLAVQLLPALEDLEAVIEVYAATLTAWRSSLEGVEWVELEGWVGSGNEAFHFWAYERRGPDRLVQWALGPGGRLGALLEHRNDHFQGWRDLDDRILSGRAMFRPEVTLAAPDLVRLQHVHFGVAFRGRGQGVLGVVDQAAAQLPVVATEARAAQFVRGLIRQGKFPLHPRSPEGPRLHWLPAAGAERGLQPGLVMEFDGESRLVGVRFRELAITRLSYGRGESAPARPEWAAWPDLPVVERPEIRIVEAIIYLAPIWDKMEGEYIEREVGVTRDARQSSSSPPRTSPAGSGSRSGAGRTPPAPAGQTAAGEAR